MIGLLLLQESSGAGEGVAVGLGRVTGGVTRLTSNTMELGKELQKRIQMDGILGCST